MHIVGTGRIAGRIAGGTSRTPGGCQASSCSSAKASGHRVPIVMADDVAAAAVPILALEITEIPLEAIVCVETGTVIYKKNKSFNGGRDRQTPLSTHLVSERPPKREIILSIVKLTCCSCRLLRCMIVFERIIVLDSNRTVTLRQRKSSFRRQLLIVQLL